MKKLLLPLLAVVCALAIAACSEQKDKLSATPEVTSAEAVASNTDWKTAYKTFLTEKTDDINESDISFDLGFVDSDDIPELFVSYGSYHAAKVDVYSFINGEVTLLCNGGEFGNIRYVEKSGYITSYYCGQGAWTYDIYEFKNGDCTKIHTAYDTTNATPDPELQELKIDGKDVSAEEMENLKEKYYSSSNEKVKAIHGPDGNERRIFINTENIEKYITEFGK
ncbi:MAG: hypothetical protein IKK85_00745 [Clostridia bacterium]|nr:hypothetical protein [Clostridia bacterium]